MQRDNWEMAVADGRRGEEEDGAALFEEEGMDFVDEDDIDHSDIPLHLRPLVSAAESGDLNALRQALGYYYLLCAWQRYGFIYYYSNFLSFHAAGFSFRRAKIVCIFYVLKKKHD